MGTLAVLLIVVPTVVAIVGTIVIYSTVASRLPTPADTVYLDPIIGATALYDRSETVLIETVQDPLGDAREWVRLAELPPYVVSATLLWEDADFLTAARFDPLEAVTRLWQGLLYGQVAPDPTLTGRLVRGTMLQNSLSPALDPLREPVLVAEVNRQYTPEDILEWHLNTSFYGSDAYGIDAAAQIYLGKRAVDLTIDEAALLVAIPLAPQFNPFDDETAARGRQQDVLRLLARAGEISPNEFDEAASRVTPIRPDTLDTAEVAPDFARYARAQAEDILDSLGLDGGRLVARGGLRIVTTLDLDLYYQGECSLRIQLERLGGAAPQPVALDGTPCLPANTLPPVEAAAQPPDSGSLVLIDVNTGELLALIGTAADENYQPGPTLYPFVYLTGFRSALFTPARMVLDTPRSFPGAREGLIYTPTNLDGAFRGPMNLRDAMGAGLLPPAADVAYREGIDAVLRNAHQIGLNSLDIGAHDLLLLERGGAAAPLDVAYAYSVFAALGDMRGVPVEPVGAGFRGRDPAAVLRIEDNSGAILWQYDADLAASCQPAFCTPVLQDVLSYVINDILADQETRWSVLGENNILDLSRTGAVINGMTGDRVDNWTVGYTPRFVVGVHLNRTDRGEMSLDAYALDGAAAVWRATMEYLHDRANLPSQGWTRPPGIVELAVCERSGMLPNGNCPVRTELFLEGTETRIGTDTYWQAFQLNSQTGQLATANTPADLRTERVFFIPPDDAADWWRANNLPLPPTDYDTVSRPQLFGSAAILQPEPFAYVSGAVDVRGSLPGDEMQYYQLAYGQGVNPDQWIDIGASQTAYVQGSSLGAWETSGLDGLYSLRLTVVMDDNSIETRVVQVTVDNIAPTIALTAGEAGQIYRFPGDTIPLAAEVQDNLAIERVEFYHNGEFVGTDESYPFGFDWETDGTGIHNFSATAFDAVGGSASADVTVEVVRAGG
jgi:membrane peptidoglycan carboxypeptidase